ncbi:hypothetical protein DSO57_1014841 [Entomophthora muscae]|uniref:Uncharacterized protein n=1 Tax=Entomophthora muscae TaxID=34485 RepID=A0ACC2S747_9FUNG|nr:hypothetical protein DSO57_1014841 [Entomophthora muscae]
MKTFFTTIALAASASTLSSLLLLPAAAILVVLMEIHQQHTLPRLAQVVMGQNQALELVVNQAQNSVSADYGAAKKAGSSEVASAGNKDTKVVDSKKGTSSAGSSTGNGVESNGSSAGSSSGYSNASSASKSSGSAQDSSKDYKSAKKRHQQALLQLVVLPVDMGMSEAQVHL